MEKDLQLQVEQRDRTKRLATLLQTLPEDDQELLRLRYAAALNFAEIGTLTQPFTGRCQKASLPAAGPAAHPAGGIQ